MDRDSTSFPRVGKIGKRFFDDVLYPQLGAPKKEVLVGPRHGCDNGIVQINDEQVMVVTTDPLTIIPALGIEDSAWLTVHLIASDLATSGIPPQYAVFDLNLPIEITREEFERYWKTIHHECVRLGIAIVAGHTGKFIGCNYTIVGGGMMLGVGGVSQYVAPTMARAGDRVVVTKGAAIATTGILARVFPRIVAENLGEQLQQRAAARFKDFSVVKDAFTAASIGVRDDGVTAMHDATEGGVLGALHELATAAECGVRVRLRDIPVAPEVEAICRLFELDPYISLGAGCLIITVRPHRVADVINALERKGIVARDVGEFLPLADGRWVESELVTNPLTPVEADPYWRAFASAMEKGWK